MTIFLIKIRDINDEKTLIYYLEDAKLKKRKLSEFRKYGKRIYMLDFDEENEKRIISRLETLKNYFLILKDVEEDKLRLLYVPLRRPRNRKEYKRLNKIKEKIKKNIKRRVIFFKTNINSILCIGDPEDLSYIKTIFTDKSLTGLEKLPDEIDAYVRPVFPEDASYLYEHGIFVFPIIEPIAFLNKLKKKGEELGK